MSIKAGELVVAELATTRGIDAGPKRWLARNRLSGNVGGLKQLRAHFSMHSEKSAISLSMKLLLLLYQPTLARNQ